MAQFTDLPADISGVIAATLSPRSTVNLLSTSKGLQQANLALYQEQQQRGRAEYELRKDVEKLRRKEALTSLQNAALANPGELGPLVLLSPQFSTLFGPEFPRQTHGQVILSVGVYEAWQDTYELLNDVDTSATMGQISAYLGGPAQVFVPSFVGSYLNLLPGGTYKLLDESEVAPEVIQRLLYLQYFLGYIADDVVVPSDYELEVIRGAFSRR